jgi:hypothetical protein
MVGKRVATGVGAGADHAGTKAGLTMGDGLAPGAQRRVVLIRPGS